MAKTLTMRVPQKMEWPVDTPALLNDIIPNAMQKETISPSILVIFRDLLAEVAQRATELHDPELDILMLRLNLYEMEGKNGGEKNRNRMKMIEMLKQKAADANARRLAAFKKDVRKCLDTDPSLTTSKVDRLLKDHSGVIKSMFRAKDSYKRRADWVAVTANRILEAEIRK